MLYEHRMRTYVRERYKVLDSRRVDVTRTEGVDPDTFWSEFTSHTARHLEDR